MTLLTGGQPSDGQPAGDPASTQTTTTQGDGGAPQAPEWLKGVEADYLNDPTMKNMKDIPTLVKSYVSAQRMIGKDKVVLPTKDSSSEEWQALYAKLGMPDQENYKVKFGEGFLAEDKAKAFQAFAREKGIMPHQLEAVSEFLYNSEKEMLDNIQKQEAETVKENLANLQKEWGHGFDKKLSQAQAVIKHFGDENTMTYLEESGLANDVTFIKLLSKMGEHLTKEDSFKTSASAKFGITPQEADEGIAKIMGNPSHPYFNPNHAEHAIAVKEMQKYFEAKNPA